MCLTPSFTVCRLWYNKELLQYLFWHIQLQGLSYQELPIGLETLCTRYLFILQSNCTYVPSISYFLKSYAENIALVFIMSLQSSLTETVLQSSATHALSGCSKCPIGCHPLLAQTVNLWNTKVQGVGMRVGESSKVTVQLVKPVWTWWDVKGRKC